MKNSEYDIHLTSIRTAFANGNAAVMVGAGFSCNAEGGDQLKMWSDIAKELWDALNPDASSSGFSTGLVTQLGEQYALAFSRPALEYLLKQLIPDDKVSPGILHDELLQLPWCEIFTTNYDTLLERAAENMVERAHFTVCCREDIPQSKILGRCRIVKLHGSFPSQRPFIFTEEDYRTYPEKFAPFVNLVRQSLLENIFCLFGFSGDDPNFLHWIGWVRDMLDKHALPIYLFLDKQPSFAQRKLLEARQVTPVVLPIVEGVDESDFEGRYRALFKNLSAPLKPPDTEWGKLSSLPSFGIFKEDEQKNFERLIAFFPTWLKWRSTYPGWIVAPTEVRNRVAQNGNLFADLSNNQWLIKKLKNDDEPSWIIALLAQYVWRQDVLLQPMDDRCAELGVRAIGSTTTFDLTGKSLEVLKILNELGIASQKEFRQKWLELAFGLLRWARQELRESTFNILRTQILSISHNDRAVSDKIEYETILLSLYLGEISVARSQLIAWEPLSTDAYMLVKKGALLAEIGEIDAGMNACLDGIQKLRRGQKTSSTDSTLLLSQEAWACVILHNIQISKTDSSALNGKANKPKESSSIEKLSHRLTTLAAKGFDVRRELEVVVAALNAETTPPAVPKNKFSGFDLGIISFTQRYGVVTQEVKLKIEAAFAWLTLIERVGLVPRIGHLSFDLTSYTQAAWWIQYGDSAERVLSIIIRTLNSEALKPKDEANSSHKTGWLSRFQVARMDITLATEICKRSIQQAEIALASGRSDHEISRICQFHVELFSRLVIRVLDIDIILAFTKNIIALYMNDALEKWHQLWEVFGTALERCFEALPPKDQYALLPLIITIPLMPGAYDNRFKYDYYKWVYLSHLIPASYRRPVNDAPPKLVIQKIEQLIHKLKNVESPSSSKSDLERCFIWERLLWLDNLDLIPAPFRKEIGELLWTSDNLWPPVANTVPVVSRFSPTPEHADPHVSFRKWILDLRLAGFIAPPETSSISHEASRRSWNHLANNNFLLAWIESRATGPWEPSEVKVGLRVIQQWWESEWDDIVHDATKLKDLREAALKRLDLIDRVLAKNIEPFLEVDTAIDKWIDQLIVDGKAIGAPFWYFRLYHAKKLGRLETIQLIQKELATVFLSSIDIKELNRAHGFMKSWIESDIDIDHFAPDVLLDALVGVVSTRHMPSLVWCLDLFVRVSKCQASWLTPTRLVMLDLGLASLLNELAYENRMPGSGIPDDDVPLLRLQCAKLAVVLHQSHLLVDSLTIEKWLNIMENDPLPEMRFLKLKIQNETKVVAIGEDEQPTHQGTLTCTLN